MSLKGHTILITGAVGGLGSSLALRCAELEADLILLDKDRRGLVQLSDKLTDAGMAAPGLYPLDLAGVGPEEFNDLFNVIDSEYAGLDALVHCALDFDSLQPLDQIQPQEWLRSMQVNVNAPWLLSVTLLPLLKKSPNSSLLFLLDDVENVTGAYWGAYGTGKSALAGMVRQFGDALSDTSVRVHGVIPGPMRTNFRSKVYHAENPLDQPDPAIVAAKIAEVLSGQAPHKDLILKLSESQV